MPTTFASAMALVAFSTVGSTGAEAAVAGGGAGASAACGSGAFF